MNLQRLSILLLLAGVAAGQTTSPTPRLGASPSGPAVPAAAAPLHDRPRPRADGPLGDELARRTPAGDFDRVLHDDPGTGVLWACGADWKASFGADGFTFVPFLGAQVPRSFPTRFRVVSLRVGGRDIPFVADSKPARSGDRITFDRGALREVYDLSLAHVEQTFVLDTALAGDVELELAVDSELTRDPRVPDLQFGNAFGGVRYGEAFSVRGQEKLAIESAWDGRTIRLCVPASLRDAGPVVVDPIISTQQTNYFTPRPARNPDVAYDVTNDVYLVVWESPASAADTDVFSEMFDGNGNRIAGSGALIDGGVFAYSAPRVANLNIADRFLVAMQRVGPEWQGRSQIYGRVRDAGGARQVHPEVRLSDATLSGYHISPAIGGDPGTLAGDDRWLVVWTRVKSATDSDIDCQIVPSTGQGPTTSDYVINGEPNENVFAPQVSRARSAGRMTWFVVYSREAAPGSYDVWGNEVDNRAGVSNRVRIDSSAADDRYPQVSSPVTDSSGRTRHLVTYERQNPASARAVVVDAASLTSTTHTDLSQAFGCGPFWVRAESDGIRFAVTSSSGAVTNRIAVATLAFDGNTLLLHEAPQLLAGSPTLPNIVSTRSGGGRATDFAITYIDGTFTPGRTALARYLGHASGPQIVQRHTACNGLSIQWDGQPLLGNTMTFTLWNFANDVPGFIFGFSTATPIPLCSTCSLGVRPDRPIFTTLGNATLSLPIPADIHLVGVSLAIQGFTVGRSTCLGSVSLSDTAEITIR